MHQECYFTNKTVSFWCVQIYSISGLKFLITLLLKGYNKEHYWLMPHHTDFLHVPWAGSTRF